MLHQQGHILNAVEIKKEWSAEEVLIHITQCLEGKIPEGTVYVLYYNDLCNNQCCLCIH